ncbi:MAG: DNA helicase II, partial [Thermodesulfobacteriota bacterium]
RFTLISNSDCHSPAKLGREANIFQSDFSFQGMRRAMEDPGADDGGQDFLATIEFFPEEGKYHLDGHRKCSVCWNPEETRDHAGICPVCGKGVTVGVMSRVMELADRERPLHPESAPAVYSLTPLPELLSELLQVGPTSKKVMRRYASLVSTFGSEFSLLLDVDLEEIEKISPLLGEAIRRLRSGQVIRQSGFDGSFGRIKLFTARELSELTGDRTDPLFGGQR